MKVPKSGEKNKLFGVYQSDCCKLEIVIAVVAISLPAQITQTE
jgi:hypothetical protein